MVRVHPEEVLLDPALIYTGTPKHILVPPGAGLRARTGCACWGGQSLLSATPVALQRAGLRGYDKYQLHGPPQNLRRTWPEEKVPGVCRAAQAPDCEVNQGQRHCSANEKRRRHQHRRRLKSATKQGHILEPDGL